MSKAIVIKLGTSTLTKKGRELSISAMKHLASQVAHLHQKGEKIVLVSSGAIAAGKEVLKGCKSASLVPEKQMLASIGQVHLMQVWKSLFEEHGIIVGQILLTRSDFWNRNAYLNIRNTLSSLLEHGIVPIINENDTVATQEIKVGDNDNLSSLVANLIGAKVLVLLTDQEGLYTANPQKDPNAKFIPVVDEITDTIKRFAQDAERGGVGTGGMATKVQAALLASRSGTETIIASGSLEGVLEKIAEGQAVGTKFLTHTTPKESRKRWLLSETRQGEIFVDSGAVQKLQHEGASLLAAGIVGTKESFQRGDIVTVLGPEKKACAIGLVNYGSEEIEKIKGLKSDQIEAILGYSYGPEVMHRDNLVKVAH